MPWCASRKQQEKLEEQLSALRGLEGVRGPQRHFDCPPKMPHGSCLCRLAALGWAPARRENRSPGMLHGWSLLPPIPNLLAHPFAALCFSGFSLERNEARVKR